MCASKVTLYSGQICLNPFTSKHPNTNTSRVISFFINDGRCHSAKPCWTNKLTQNSNMHSSRLQKKVKKEKLSIIACLFGKTRWMSAQRNTFSHIWWLPHNTFILLAGKQKFHKIAKSFLNSSTNPCAMFIRCNIILTEIMFLIVYLFAKVSYMFSYVIFIRNFVHQSNDCESPKLHGIYLTCQNTDTRKWKLSNLYPNTMNFTECIWIWLAFIPQVLITYDLSFWSLLENKFITFQGHYMMSVLGQTIERGDYFDVCGQELCMRIRVTVGVGW